MPKNWRNSGRLSLPHPSTIFEDTDPAARIACPRNPGTRRATRGVNPLITRNSICRAKCQTLSFLKSCMPKRYESQCQVAYLYNAQRNILTPNAVNS